MSAVHKMEEISNESMWFYKKLLPWAYLLIFGLATAGGFAAKAPVFGSCGVAMLIMSGVTFKYYIWSLPDHVYLSETCVIVEKGGDRDEIPLSRVKNVAYGQRYGLVTMSIRDGSKFGDEIRFKPMTNFGGFTIFPSTPESVTRLIDAADHSRQL